MDEHSGFKPPDEDRPPEQAEGVRIIGAEEAAEAMERGDVARRRGDDIPRYGDRPSPPPEGPRPALRFPLGASSDPTAIQRPPVQPAPDPDWEAPLPPVDPPLLPDPPVSPVDARWPEEPVAPHAVPPPAAPEWPTATGPASEAEWPDPAHDAERGWPDPEAGPESVVGGPAPLPWEQPGADDAVELPHWTEPATGEVPKILGGDEQTDEDLEAWSSFAGAAPRWRDASTEYEADDDFGDLASLGGDEARLGALDESDRPSHAAIFSFDELDRSDHPEPVRLPDDATAVDNSWDDKGAGGSAIGPDPAYDFDDGYDEDPGFGDDGVTDGDYPDSPVYVPPSRDRGDARRADRRSRNAARPAAGGSGRDVPTAVGVGVAFAAVALILFRLGPKFSLVLVTAVLIIAAAELFNGLRRAGYQPATLLGLAATTSLSLAVYWKGEAAYPLVMFLTVAFGLLWYLAGVSDEEPILNLGVTLLGVLWIGLLGSFASLILTIPSEGVSILLAAVLITVGYDVGGFVVGRRFGRRSLSAVSPSKTVEGLVGGMVAAVAVSVVFIGIWPGIGPFDSFGDALLLGVAIAVAAPLGDLCESLVKRELGVKDLGTILPGHGGLLDRFDALLFVLPTTYYVVRLVLT
ncbi:hypothetical protein BH24ACT3_BH24ACT3_02750 [soil metagenome]